MPPIWMLIFPAVAFLFFVLLVPIGLLIIVGAFAGKGLTYAEIIGKSGESLVNKALCKGLDENDYAVLHNVTLPSLDGTTQIDHIVLSQYGVWVIETKNMSGWIFGEPNAQYWMQVHFKQKHRFQNPLRQNYRHIRAVVEHSEIPEAKVIPLIVFAGESVFKTPMPPDVTKLAGLLPLIRQQTKKELSRDEVINAIVRLLAARLNPDKETHDRHVTYLRNRSDWKKQEAII
jgi:hypothetical protein